MRNVDINRIVLELHDSEVVMVHDITIGDKHWYWQVGSLNGFRNRTCKRVANHQDKARRGLLEDGVSKYMPSLYFMVCEPNDLDANRMIGMAYGSGIAASPRHHYDSIFDFYRAVEIDYKKDKWPTLQQRKERIDDEIQKRV